MKTIAKFLLAFCIFFFTANTILAQDEEVQFLTEYDFLYDINENGETLVSQKITITNVQNDIIATSYSLSINQMNVYGIDAKTDNKSLKVTELKDEENNVTTLTVNFDDYVVGEGRQNQIELFYKTKDVAVKFGEIWNIHIPNTDLSNSTSRYNVQLKVPKSFGNKVFVSPKPNIESEEKNKQVFAFTKESLNNQGINAAFGEYQVLNFNLKYQLENPYIIPSTIDIALPPEIRGVQQVVYTNISPEPKKISLDSDGNTIASYRLNGSQKLEVVAGGSAKLLGRQIDPSKGGTFDQIPKEIYNAYTKEQQYWETGSSTIEVVAESLYSPTDNISTNAKNIYDYVTSTLKYDFGVINQDNIGRKGAESALNLSNDTNSNACMEFTDSFIALARSMGIPARELNGFAFTNEESYKPLSINLKGGDFLHAWPEFYDPAFGWVQIDPTWGNTSKIDYFTKLDTNHFIFVIKGESSEYPLPAGTYRFDDSQNEKLVEVVFSQKITEKDFEHDFELNKTFNYNILELIKGNDRYVVENKGDTFVYLTNGKPVPPSTKAVFYQDKNTNEIDFLDFNGNTFSKTL